MTHKAIIPILKICLNIRIAFCFAEASNEMCFWLCGCFQKFHRSFKTAKRSYLILAPYRLKICLFSVFLFMYPLVCIKRITQICSIDGILVQYGPWKSFSGLEMPFRQCARSWKISKNPQIRNIIMGFKFFERENKNYMSKVKFVIFSILFTECFYHFSILRN